MNPIEFIKGPTGRIEVMLGAHLVGEIRPRPFSRVNAHYSLYLPILAGRASPRGATSVRVARRNILHQIAEWFDSCGEGFEPIAESIRRQAEDERAAA